MLEFRSYINEIIKTVNKPFNYLLKYYILHLYVET